MNIKIFDWDGTLAINTNYLLYQSYAEASKSYDLEFTFEEFLTDIYPNSSIYFLNKGLSASEFEKLRQTKNDLYLIKYGSNIILNEGLLEIAEMNTSAIVTNTSSSIVNTVLNNYNKIHLFEFIIGIDSKFRYVKKIKKPSPNFYIEAFLRFESNFNNSNYTIFEDSEIGYKSAISAKENLSKTYTNKIKIIKI